MYYYRKHIGDYVKKTAHLSPLEHGVYNLILDSYYDREKAPTLLEATRWARARTEEEKAAVLGILDEFFTQNEDGTYRNARVEEELKSYQAMAEINRQIAINREKTKREKKEKSRQQHEACTDGSPEVARSEHENSTVGAPNQEPLTVNHNSSSSEQSSDKPKQKKWGTEEDHKAARWVFSMIRKLNPSAREPNWDGWAHDIRLMRESDGRNHHQICEMFKKANADSFWQSNVLSPAKLREKWDQLAVKFNGASIVESAKIPRREVVL